MMLALSHIPLGIGVMSEFLAVLQKWAGGGWNQQVAGPIWKYVQSGDPKCLAPLKQCKSDWSWQLYWMDDAWTHMAPPGQLSVEEQRALQVASELDALERPLEHWLKPVFEKRLTPDERYHEALVEAVGNEGEAKRRTTAATIYELGKLLEHRDGTPNSAGRYLLSLTDKELAQGGDKAVMVMDALGFILRHAPKRVATVAPSFLHEGSKGICRSVSDRCARLLLESDAKLYEKIVATAAEKEKKPGPKARVLEVLAEFFPKAYRDTAQQANLKVIESDLYHISYNDASCSGKWLLTTYGPAILPQMKAFFAGGSNGNLVTEVLDAAIEMHKEAAAPAAVMATEHPYAPTRRAALQHLMTWPKLGHEALIRQRLSTGLIDSDAKEVVQFIGLIGRWKPAMFEEELWKLFDHKSKPVRLAAARALAKNGEAAVKRAIELLSGKKTAVRSTAVALLGGADSTAATAALESHLDCEADEDVRDQILMALEQAWELQGRKITRADIDRRIERTADRLKQPIAKWLDEKRLPALSLSGKKRDALPPVAIRYLLYRQSRAKEIRPDVEAKALYNLIDRQTSGDFALKVLQSFFASENSSDDRWAMTVAGLLGDDRCVPPLMQQIRKWVDSNRGKMAEYAAQALALLGTDVALSAVDSLSIRYRSKQKNIGKAAAEAFAETAERLGITPDELGDRVVPWLGFEPEQPRLIALDDKSIEVRISLDHKLEFRDLAKGKKLASLPAGVSAEVKNEFKDLVATLKEVVKGQLIRIENLMVRQFRWPVGRWRELYLRHPVLFPFAVRMIWGVYDEHGKLIHPFRCLEDRTLTDEKDETLELPKKGQIGLVHPLELSAEARRAWATHLADYEIESPILQMERAVTFPQPDEKQLKLSSKYKGTDLNGMTFKGRAERLGWQRGSVIDGGGISSYRKCYPGAGAEALLEVDGMYIGMGMEETIKLGRLSFIKAGSVTFGSYTYDDPSDEKDSRLIQFGEVPPIVFSETLGDLKKIAGVKQENEA
jgi:hypothetical protein